MTGRSSFPPYEPPAEPLPEQAAFPQYQPPAPAGSVSPSPGPGAAPAPTQVPAPASGRKVISVATALLALTVLAVVAGGIALRSSGQPETVSTPSGPIEAGGNSIKAELEAKRARYVDARKEGRLASVGLRDGDPFDDTAVLAFAYLLTDKIIAAGFGVDDDTAAEFAREAAEHERRLLAHEPLGDDIEIVFSEDRVFRYDGSTGEGGYVTS